MRIPGRVIVARAATGPAWTGSPAEAPAGSVLVRRTATPDLVLGVGRIIGAVFEADGVASHAAILAREWGLPCMVGVAGCATAGRRFAHVELHPADGTVVFRDVRR